MSTSKQKVMKGKQFPYIQLNHVDQVKVILSCDSERQEVGQEKKARKNCLFRTSKLDSKPAWFKNVGRITF